MSPLARTTFSFLPLIIALAWSSDAASAPLPRTPYPKSPVDILTKPAPYHVSVKFVDAARIRTSAPTVVYSEAGFSVVALQNFINANGLSLTPEIGLAPAVIAAVEAEALAHSNRMQPDLAGMFRLAFATTNPTEQQNIANGLQELALVEVVHASHSLPPPPVDIPPTTPLYESSQTYFAPNPGLDIDYAAGFFGLRGEGMRYADIEYCWLNEHEDIEERLLPEPNVSPSQSGFNICSHGAAATSMLTAVPNAYGLKGMAPNAVAYVHPEHKAGGANGIPRRPEAITSAHWRTEPGDVLMLEMQEFAGGAPGSCSTDCPTCGPAEINPFVHAATKTATDALRVVVAAAGNGCVNTDTHPGFAEWRQMSDSGAIIVGAGTSDAVHQPMPVSSWGSRVNLQGWGENVATFGYFFPVPGAPNDPRQTYRFTFGGTSGATPMVAAAALLTQQHAKIRLGSIMTPRELRRYLAATGVPQAPHERNIGAFPSMRGAIDRMVEADVGVTAEVGGSLVTAQVTNHGPSRARQLVVDVDIYSGSVIGLSFVDNGLATCAGRPPPELEECAGQCSYLRCTYQSLPAGPAPLTWACSSAYGSPSVTLKAHILSGSHVDPNPNNHVATRTAALSCDSGGVEL